MTEPRGPGISKRVIGTYLVLAAVVVVGGGAGGSALWLRWNEPLPPPPHDQRELGQAPAPHENGMEIIAELPEDALDMDEWPDDELFQEHDGPPSLEALERARGGLEAFSMPEPITSQLQEALARPRFAFVCPLDLTDPCPVLRWHRYHRALVALTVRDALLGFDDEALVRAERIVRADRDLLTSARTVIEAAFAAMSASLVIELAAILGAIIGARDADAIDPNTAARVAAVDDALTGLDPASWSMERALIGEWIQTRRAAVMITDVSGRNFGTARAIRAIDAYHEALIAYARDPQHVARPVLPASEDFSWILEPYAPLAVTGLAADRPLPDEGRALRGAAAGRPRGARGRRCTRRLCARTARVTSAATSAPS